MKKISNRDGERILTYLQKAKAIFAAAEEKSDDGLFSMDSKKMNEIINEFGGLEYYFNNTIGEG